MRLIELIITGVPGTQGALRYPFQPGLNPWKQKGLYELSFLTETIASLLYPNSSEGKPLGPGKAQKAGMTFEARGQTYRIIRDFGKKSLQLDQLDVGSKDSFHELSREQRFITETLRRSVKVPGQKVFRSLLCARPGAPLVPIDMSASMGGPAPSETAGREKLKKLYQERERHQKVIEDERKVDELQSRIFAIDESLRRLDDPREQLRKIQKEYKPYEVFDRPGVLTTLILEKVKTYPKLLEKRQDDLAALDEKAQGLHSDASTFLPRPVWKEAFVFAGAAGVIASFIAAAFLRPYVWPFRLTLLAIVVSFGLIGWGILRGLKRQESIELLQKDIRSLETEKMGIEKRFEIETNSVKKFFEDVRQNDVDEILEMLKHRETLKGGRARGEAELLRIESEVPEDKLKKERTQVEKEIGILQEKLRDIPPLAADPNTIEHEIRDLEAVLKSSSSDSAPSIPDETDEVNLLMHLAAEMLDRPFADILANIRKGIAANVSVMTDSRFADVEAVGGRIGAFKKADGSLHHWKSTDPETRSLLYFSVQFTLWQMMAALHPLPIVIDYLEGNVSDRFLNLSLTAAKHLAKKTQVLVWGS